MPSNVFNLDPNLLEESPVKYLFLYHHKGKDLVTTTENLEESNYEIEMYHQRRYISAVHACFRLLDLEQPSVKQLPLHLPHSVFSHGHLYVGFSRWIPNSTPEAAKSARRSWFALSDYFGPNSALLTVAPDDIQRE